MPLYELLALSTPLLPREQLSRMIQRVAGVLYSSGAVVTDVKSYGDQYLAYKIKGTRGKYQQAHMWQLDFAVAPEVLKDVNHELRVNEQVLRWVVVKKEQYPPLHDLRHMLANSERLAVPGVLDSAAAAQPPPAAGGAGGSPAAQP